MPEITQQPLGSFLEKTIKLSKNKYTMLIAVVAVIIVLILITWLVMRKHKKTAVETSLTQLTVPAAPTVAAPTIEDTTIENFPALSSTGNQIDEELLNDFMSG